MCEALLTKWYTVRGEYLLGYASCADRLAPGDFEPEAEGGIRWSILDFLFILQRYLLELRPHDMMRREICLNTCDRILAQIEILAEKGDLNVMQDTASCMTSSLVVFLRKVRVIDR